MVRKDVARVHWDNLAGQSKYALYSSLHYLTSPQSEFILYQWALIPSALHVWHMYTHTKRYRNLATLFHPTAHISNNM